MDLEFSVIIPTYNRAEILIKTLCSLSEQTFSKEQFEVIVVNDGSTDETEKILNGYQEKDSNLNLRFYSQKNSGQGLARNRAIAKSKGRILVFIGDDIILDKNFLSEHFRTHQKHSSGNAAVLGFIDWHPELEISDFMKWLTDGSSIFAKFGGHQFAFEKLLGKEEADYNFFYTSNISVKREIIEKKEDQFDEDFGGYGWEDIEIAYRLYKKYGLKVFYNSKAIGYHHHFMDSSGLKNRMQAIGKSAHIIHSKHPELKKVPGKLKQLIFIILGSIPSLALIWLMKSVSKRYLALWYYALSKRYFMQGLGTSKL